MINQAAIIAEVRTVFLRYEAALLAHDVASLNDFFLASDSTVRYGVAEQQYGIAAIRAYREHAAPVNPRRQLQNTVITAIGSDAASVCTEFFVPGEASLGRQTQTWVRTEAGWKILAAHVSSLLPEG